MGAEAGLRIAFVAGLSDKKLGQKLSPLLAMDDVTQVELFRRSPYPESKKLRAFPTSRLGRRLPFLGDLERLFCLLWRARHCDVVVGCFQLYHGVLAHVVGRLWNKPVIQLVITDVDWNIPRFLARWCMLRADACGVRGPVSVEKLRAQRFNGPIAVIHNPIGSLPQILPVASPSHDVIAVGNFALEKDYPTLVSALGLVKKRLGRLKAMICGEGFPGILATALDQAGITNDVDFPGHLHAEALEAAFAASRILVLSSAVEGLPMVAVEAMAHGLPVVSTNVGEMDWLICDGVEGRLTQPGDPLALAEAVIGLLSQPDRLAAMGRSARDRVRELAGEFDIQQISSSWKRLFRELGLRS